MTILVPVILAALAQQPQQRPAATAQTPAAPAQGTSQPVVPRPVPTNAYDSTVRAISDVGTAVAEVKNSLDLFRRSTLNEPAGAVLQRATLLRASCRAMAEVTQSASRTVCRTCVAAQIRPALDRYRTNLPTTSRVGQQCASRLQRAMASGTPEQKAQKLRTEMRPLSSLIVEGLTPYEARLREIRVAWGWAPPVVPQQRVPPPARTPPR